MNFLIGGAQVPVPDFNLDGALPTYDLKELPLPVALLQIIGIRFRDTVVRQHLQAALNELEPTIESSLASYGGGYLLETNIFLDESGNIDVPGGQLLTPIGLGREPIDALAEFDREAHIGNAHPNNFRNESFYLWISVKDHKLIATAIEHEFRIRLGENALQEAQRRNGLEAWFRATPNGATEHIQRAQYWQDLYERTSAQLRSEEERAKIRELNRRAQNLQDRMNQLLQRYDRTVSEIVQVEAANATLNRIQTVTSILSNAVAIGNASYSKEDGQIGTISTAGTANPSISEIIVRKSVERTNLLGEKTKVEFELHARGSEFQNLDDAIWNQWKSGGVTVRRPDPVPNVSP